MATIVYVAPMLTILKTTDFDKWLAGLRSAKDRARILDRIVRVEGGNFGDHASVGEGVSELRFFSDRDTAFTTCLMATRSSSCCAAATRGLSPVTSAKPKR